MCFHVRLKCGPAMPYFDSPLFEQSQRNPSATDIAASITPWASLGRRDRQDLLTDQTWQQKLRHYDRNGPGILGASLDMPAATSMLIDLCVRRRTARGHEVVKDDPVLTALLNMWRGDTLDQKHLFSRLLRTLDGPAECYLILHNAQRPGRLYWQLAQTTQVQDNRDGTVSIRGRRDARRGDKWYQQVQDRWVYHAMNADLEWDGEPWSQLRRALPHLEQHKAAQRAISRNLDSQLAMNGIMWAKAVGAATNWPDAMADWGARAIGSDDGVESVIPFPMVTAEKPEWIDVGRSDHEDQIKVADMFLKAFAQSVDLPTQMLLEGPGAGNHWSDYLVDDFYSSYVMAPRLTRVCNVITETHLRPLLRGLPSTAGYLNPDDYEVWYDDTAIRSKVDNTERILRARELGIVDRETVLEAVGGNPEQLLDLPEGFSDFDSWIAARNPAAVSIDNEDEQQAQALVGQALPALPSGDANPAVVNEPDRDEAQRARQQQLDRGPPPIPAAPGEIAAAVVEVEGELMSRRPDYWLDLVPCRR